MCMHKLGPGAGVHTERHALTHINNTPRVHAPQRSQGASLRVTGKGEGGVHDALLCAVAQLRGDRRPQRSEAARVALVRVAGDLVRLAVGGHEGHVLNCVVLEVCELRGRGGVSKAVLGGFTQGWVVS